MEEREERKSPDPFGTVLYMAGLKTFFFSSTFLLLPIGTLEVKMWGVAGLGHTWGREALLLID
jgi:hypothetical protein